MFKDIGLLQQTVAALVLACEFNNGLPFPPDCDQTPNRDGPRRIIQAIREEMNVMRDEARLRKAKKK